jgi:uncharacterized protein VirK/YbjX
VWTIGRSLTDGIRNWVVTPLKIFANQKPLNDLTIVLNYYPHSSMKGFTQRELINEYLFSLLFHPKKKIGILIFQYKFLWERLTPQKRDAMSEGGIICWERTFTKYTDRIVLKITQKYECEGCLSLIYSFESQDIYIISFTICSGLVFGFDDKNIILVSRIQGVQGKHGEIVKASKQLADIFPASALMSALEGLCLSLGVNKIVCISAKNQVSFVNRDLGRPAIQYDRFWETFEEYMIVRSGDYLIRIPFAVKSTRLIRSKFRKRTLSKRAIKGDISKMTNSKCDALFSLPSLPAQI